MWKRKKKEIEHLSPLAKHTFIIFVVAQGALQHLYIYFLVLLLSKHLDMNDCMIYHSIIHVQRAYTIIIIHWGRGKKSSIGGRGELGLGRRHFLPPPLLYSYYCFFLRWLS